MSSKHKAGQRLTRWVPEEEKPIGWVDAELIEQAVELLKTEQTIDQPKPAASFFTNEFFAD